MGPLCGFCLLTYVNPLEIILCICYEVSYPILKRINRVKNIFCMAVLQNDWHGIIVFVFLKRNKWKNDNNLTRFIGNFLHLMYETQTLLHNGHVCLTQGVHCELHFKCFFLASWTSKIKLYFLLFLSWKMHSKYGKI